MEKQSYTIFLVEDDVFYGKILQSFLIESGYHQCYLYENAASFMNELHLKPDIIFLDYFIGNDNGNTYIEEIHQILPDCKVVMVSGQEYVHVSLTSMKLGAYDYIEKNNNTLQTILDVIHQIKKDQSLNIERPNKYKGS